MKNARQQKILEIIEKYDIDTQELIIEKLGDAGINATQTTISRDIRELKLVKAISASGVYRYVLPTTKKEVSAPVLNSALTESVKEIVAAGNIVVVKTYPGMANALAVCVDSLEKPHIIGSVAGDDTILLVVKNEEVANEVAQELKKAFGVN